MESTQVWVLPIRNKQIVFTARATLSYSVIPPEMLGEWGELSRSQPLLQNGGGAQAISIPTLLDTPQVEAKYHYFQCPATLSPSLLLTHPSSRPSGLGNVCCRTASSERHSCCFHQSSRGYLLETLKVEPVDSAR